MNLETIIIALLFVGAIGYMAFSAKKALQKPAKGGGCSKGCSCE